MTGAQKFAVWFAGIYLIFWIAGDYSFDYTHECVRSHTEERYDSDGNPYDVRVCDWYSANGKRWTFGDPARACTS